MVHERVSESRLTHQVERILYVLFRLAGEPHQYIGRKRDARYAGTYVADKLQIMIS